MQNKGTTTRQIAVRLTAPSSYKNHRALYLINAVPPETLPASARNQQANHLIAGVRRFLQNRPEFRIAGSEADMIAHVRATGGHCNVWVVAR